MESVGRGNETSRCVYCGGFYNAGISCTELLKMAPPKCDLYIIDPYMVTLPKGCTGENIHIHSGASRGLEQLKAILKLK